VKLSLKPLNVIAPLLTLALNAAHPLASAIQTMPVITVYGSSGMGAGGIGGGGSPTPDFAAIIQFQQGLATAGDVRCLKSQSSKTMSTSGLAERSVAAEEVFAATQRWAVSNPKYGRGGLVRGDAMNIIYADGGTEQWYVSSPTAIRPLYGEVKDSLRLGTGRLTPNGMCR
jgi:hypothetical protein